MYYHYYEFPGWHSVRKHYGVRTEHYKLIHFYGNGTEEWNGDTWEMYDFINDPHELVNLYGMPQFANIQKDLEVELDRLMDYYKDTKFDPSDSAAKSYPEEEKIQWIQDKITYMMRNMEVLPDEQEFFTN